MTPKAFIFDVFGTIVDWRTGVANEVQKFFSDKNIDFSPLEFADLWRGEYDPSMKRIRDGNRGYVALDVLHRENLVTVLGATKLLGHFSEEEISSLNHAWEKLPGWPDSSSGLHALKQKAIIAPCSNGSIAIMTRIAKYSDLPSLAEINSLQTAFKSHLFVMSLWMLKMAGKSFALLHAAKKICVSEIPP